MGLISKSWTLGCAMLGLAALSQFPEFAQQYRQRIGGGIDELATVIADFDKDAAERGLNREQGLVALGNSVEELPQLRAKSMRKTIDRFENLTDQRDALEQAAPAWRPIHVLKYPDPQTLKGAWEIFEPAVPLTLAGLIWGGAGALGAGLIGRAPVSLTRRARRRRQDRMLGL